MHELSLAQNIIAIVREEMKKHQATVLTSLTLAVGKMSGVVPDSLTFCLELITQGTDLQGVDVLIDVIPLRCACRDCKEEFEISQFTTACPQCESRNITVISGRELSIVELEVEDTGAKA